MSTVVVTALVFLCIGLVIGMSIQSLADEEDSQ